MKALNLLNNVEKVNLLVSLFPDHKIGICKMIADVNTEISLNVQTLKDSWQMPLISFEYWRSLADACAKVVIKYDEGKRLKTARIFADQLADGMLALFTIHCIAQYAKNRSNDESFQDIVKVLFEYKG